MAKSRAPHISLRPYTGQWSGTGSSTATDVLCNANISANGSKFDIKLTKAQIRLAAGTMNATGETTTGLPDGTFTRGIRVYPLGIEQGQASLVGHVVGGGQIGLTNIVGTAAIEVKMVIGEDTAKRKLTFWMVPSTVDIDWDYTLPYVGLSISGPMTNNPTIANANDLIAEGTL